jgi:type IV pilus biogenesis protein CpaD/CtpE
MTFIRNCLRKNSEDTVKGYLKRVISNQWSPMTISRWSGSYEDFVADGDRPDLVIIDIIIGLIKIKIS